MSFKSVAINLWKRGLKDVLNPIKRKVFIKDFLEDYYKWKIIEPEEWGKITKQQDISASSKLISKEFLPTFCEQFVYRKLKCGECIIAGNCKHCGCAVPANMISEEADCSAGKWGPMKMDKQSWDRFKKEERLLFKIDNY